MSASLIGRLGSSAFGGLMAYGASFGDLYRRVASQVSKILQGAKASDLTDRTTCEVRVRTEHADGQIAWPLNSAITATLADEVIE